MDGLNEVYYPIAKIEENKRDIAIVELENAQNLSNNQTKIYSQFANIIIAVSTFIISIILSLEKLELGNLLSKNNLMLFSIFLFFIGFLLLRYFVDLQKEITINARKVVTLRSMLGLDYSSIQLTLPKDRIEGATNPFNIRFFNGWFKFQTIPFSIIIILVSFLWTINFYEIDLYSISENKYIFIDKVNIVWVIGLLIISILYYITYRVSLYDRNETFLLHIAVLFSKLFKIKLLQNFEYSIYRSKLSYLDLERLHIDFKNIIPILIKIEDKNYLDHNGIDYKAILRAIISQIPPLKKRYNLIKSGASTLNMQLARTLFIPTNQKAYKRKFLELFISKWLNQILSKQELLYIYTYLQLDMDIK